jgi:hypothetical protein
MPRSFAVGYREKVERAAEVFIYINTSEGLSNRLEQSARSEADDSLSVDGSGSSDCKKWSLLVVVGVLVLSLSCHS